LRIAGLVATFSLISCAGYQPWGTTFIRSDGKDVSADQLAVDRSACADASEKLEDCMSGKGYALVKEEEASQKQKEIAKKREEAEIVEINKKVSTLLAKSQKNQKSQARPRREAAVAAVNTTSLQSPSPWSSSAGDNLPALPWPSKGQ
jgi:hypothetical protein